MLLTRCLSDCSDIYSVVPPFLVLRLFLGCGSGCSGSSSSSVGLESPGRSDSSVGPEISGWPIDGEECSTRGGWGGWGRCRGTGGGVVGGG